MSTRRMAKLNMKLCCGVLVAVVVLSNHLADGCDTSRVPSCFSKYTGIGTLLSFITDKDKFCQDIQNLIQCVKGACHGGVPGEVVEKITGIVTKFNMQCDLSALNGSNTVGGPPLFLLAAVAVCLLLVLRPAFL